MDDLLAVAVYARDRVNPYLFNYALSVALLHRTDTQELDIPSIIHSFPDKYIDSKVFSKAREDANVVPEGSRVCAHAPKTHICFEECFRSPSKSPRTSPLPTWRKNIAWPTSAKISA